ncbi:WD40 repeat-like protein [Eremomyces bilateralis CBS 781.70]|uniref:WD40 repeat-like protein n=1 Tax=Eremomyces bilateralis CBS 781.70 TaxID=1392243 RepID=A0A6G1G834_9PEZI|nr:WD40 repeat-like protein [Eremomyces bilateralis CBS 781.70]KAF1814227.1 WD40 repeat-like protein [Eremomyces bilateralis CBS 781.70]
MALNYVTFNQDYSYISAGTTKGFRQYTTEPFEKHFETNEGDISLVEMLFSTSLVALVLSPRLLRIQNTKRQSTICDLTFPSRVLAVRMNRKRLVVVLEDSIYVYDISNMNLIRRIETSPNPHAICALSSSSENNYLVYPLPQKVAPSPFAPPSHTPPTGTHVAPTTGEVMIFDATKMEAVNVVEAHQTPLSCVSLNGEGNLLATASEKGTIIRVFSVPLAQKLFQFRRGSIPARIFSMSFNATSSLLCVSSATETVHIFRLVSPQKASSRPGSATSSPRSPTFSPTRDRSASISSEDHIDSGSMDYESIGASTAAAERKPLNPTLASMIRRTSQNMTKTFASSLGTYLPTAVTEIWEPQRDFAWVKVPRSTAPNLGEGGGPVRTVVAMRNNTPQLMVVTSAGAFYVYNIDLEKGGEGVLEHQFSFIEANDRLGRSLYEE